MKIAILVPTRERPLKFKQLVDSLIETTTCLDNLTIYCYLDSDDPELSNYEQFSEKIKYTIGPPISISKSWNIIAEQAFQEGADILIMGNDDVIYRTKDWDTILINHINKLPHKYFCIWFKDGIQDGRHATFPVLTKEWYVLLDHRFTPGIFNHQFNDTWIFDIAKRAEVCHYINEIFTEHLHYVRGKSELDNTYKRVVLSGYMTKDKKIFLENESERILLAERIKSKINENCKL